MPTPDEITANKERLYESSSLRDDLNDTEATILLEWGQGQVDRIAEQFPDDFSQKARFLRQVIKGINRFVGQREFNDRAGQEKYMGKITQYLPHLSWDGVTGDTLFAALPDDASAMLLNLRAILGVLDRALEPETGTEPPAAPHPGSNQDAAFSDVSDETSSTVMPSQPDAIAPYTNTDPIDNQQSGDNQGDEPEKWQE